MQLPSIKYLSQSTLDSLKRFTLTLVCAFLVFVTGSYQIITEFDSESQQLITNLIITFALGVPLFFATRIWSETQADTPKTTLITSVLGILTLLLIYFSLPKSPSTLNTNMPYIRYGLYSIVIHLLVSVAPVIRNKMKEGFWQYNKQLFIRLWTSLLFAAVIYGGISVAFLVIGELFDIKIPYKFYGVFYVFANSILNIWIFTAGIEKNIADLDSINTTPKGIKIFSQYILLPLLLIYLIIVYSYGFKILLTSDWPKGLVSFLIIGISLLGYLTNLLLHPYANEDEQSWIKKFYKAFYILMFPLAILLFFAVGIRISEYGITINRYYLILLGIWITFTSVYQLIKQGDIKMIPISLAIFVGLSSFGFWGAESISENSQVKRLENILKESGLLKDGKLINEYDLITSEPINDVPFPQITDTTQNNINSIIKYLDNYHRFDKIAPWFQQDISDIQTHLDSTDRSTRFNEAQQIQIILGEKDWNTIQTSKYIRFRSKNDNTYTVKGYDILYNYSYHEYNKDNISSSELLDSLYEISYDYDVDIISIKLNETPLINIPVRDFIDSMIDKSPEGNYDLKGDDSYFQIENENCDVRVEFRDLDIYEKNKRRETDSFDASIYIKFKD